MMKNIFGTDSINGLHPLVLLTPLRGFTPAFLQKSYSLICDRKQKSNL